MNADLSPLALRASIKAVAARMTDYETIMANDAASAAFGPKLADYWTELNQVFGELTDPYAASSRVDAALAPLDVLLQNPYPTSP